LLSADKRAVLAASKSLADVGVLPGAELLFRPKHDTIFVKLLDKLYDEAKGYAKDQLKDMAKDRLKTILRLDPKFPDPAELRKDLLKPGDVGQKITDAATLPRSDPTVKPKKRVEVPTKEKLAKSKPKSGVSTGCVIAGVVVAGGTVVIGGMIAVALFVYPLLREMFSFGSDVQDVVLGTGDVQVTLRWDSSADLDLHVIDPWGDEIFFGQKWSESGGELDVDANANCDTQPYSPVENIYWPTGGAPSGTYQVYVVDYNDCGESDYTYYEVVVRVNNRVYGSYSGEIFGWREQQFVVSFDW
jgi:hypothetical protein